ncbi:MAG: ankyrin repeat domain-containing protein [Cyanobacteria bacterium J06635_10]
MHHPNNIIAQRYEIISTLGEGGSGITYLAKDLQNNQTVALKALSLHHLADWKAMELFEREAKILAQLNHPGIPYYLEYFHADTNGDRSQPKSIESHFYIAQQLAPGKSLEKLVEENWRTNEQQVKDIAIQILEILIYLHSLTPPVTHRDIKPQNIIRDKDGKVFLVDFGAVQDTYYSTFMRGSTVVGTYGYMAPEQFRGQAVPATDLYGLGATLLFLLTHRSPADFPTDGLKIDFRSRVKVSDDFADWLDKMLEPDLEERFSSAHVALEVLRGKRKIIIAAKKPMLLKAAIAMGITTVITASIFNNYKWAILGTLGFKPPDTICSNVDEMRDYLNKGGTPDLELYEEYTYYRKPTFGSTREKWNLLLCALKHKSQPVAELLIANNANINDAFRRANSVEYKKFLIAKGADVHSRDKHGQTALHYAVLNHEKEIIELLLSHQVDINAKDKFGNTPLHLMFQRYREFKDLNIQFHNNLYRNFNSSLFPENERKKLRLSMIKLLVNNGAIVNAQNNQDYTPFHFAQLYRYENEIKYLIDKSANINQKSKDGKTPLMLRVAKGGNYCILKLLIDNGADVNAQDKYGDTALHFAIMNHRSIVYSLTTLLVESGANINTKNYNSETPLHKLLERGYPLLTHHLIRMLADVNAKDSQGNTPLHKAIKTCQENGNCEQYILKKLVMYGADIHAKNNHGLTPLQMAVTHKDIVKNLDKLLMKWKEDYKKMEKPQIQLESDNISCNKYK